MKICYVFMRHTYMFNLSTREVEPEDPYPGHILGSLPHKNKNKTKNEMPIISFLFYTCVLLA